MRAILTSGHSLGPSIHVPRQQAPLPRLLQQFLEERLRNVALPQPLAWFFGSTRPQRSVAYLPTSRIENESGSIGPRPGRPPAGGGVEGVPNSAAISRMWLVLASSVSVLALCIGFYVLFHHEAGRVVFL